MNGAFESIKTNGTITTLLEQEEMERLLRCNEWREVAEESVEL
jgi:hypothetical protein